MKQFINYFKVITRASKFKAYPFGAVAAVIILYFINVLCVGDGSGWFPFVATFAYLIGIMLFCPYGTPNMETAFPANHKKKLTFRFLSSLVVFLMFIVAMLAAVLVVQFVRWLFEPSEVKLFASYCRTTLKAIGVYGGLFGFGYFIVMYSSGMITGFLKRRKHRNIFLILLCAGQFLFYFIAGIHYNNYIDVYSGPRVPFSNYYYGSMNLPWLFIIIWFLVAANFFGWALYLGIKHYDPKKF